MVAKNYFLLFIIIMSYTANAQIQHGTCVTYAIQDNTVVLASDNQINHEDGSKSTGQKIHNVGKSYWACTGLYRFSTLFNIDTIINTAISKHMSFSDTQNEIKNNTIGPLKTAVKAMKDMKLTKFLNLDIPILSIVFFYLKMINYCMNT